MAAPKRMTHRAAGILFLAWLPVVAVATVLVVAVGWHVVLCFLVIGAAALAKVRLELRRIRTGRPLLGSRLQLLLFLSYGAVAGGLLLGGPGAILGLVFGAVLGLPPVSVRNRAGVVAPLDPRDATQREAVDRSFALLLVAMLVGLALLLLIGVLLERFA